MSLVLLAILLLSIVALLSFGMLTVNAREDGLALTTFFALSLVVLISFVALIGRLWGT